ncbi:MAG: hypothetical protein JJ971_12475 [Balneolaceae bacterium]|nr:hypothetical protein [Balneolaceae bacterium]MBO6547333.1 hypothetical protein [Balneolaceae bacterium]MBO6647720.1 hypothetical protein [Balneolaceae bacterium]
MGERNSYRNQQPDNFDLDNYIEEKANSEQQTYQSKSESLPKKSSWFKNTMLLFGFGILTLLYFNNWSPLQVYGNIFGIEKYQAGYVAPSSEAGTPLVIELNPENGAQIVDLRDLENLSELEGLETLRELGGLSELSELERLSELEELQNSMAGLENMEEMNELREFALRTAMEALEGIGNSPEFGEAIGEASQLGIQEALKELRRLRETELSGAELVAEEAREVNSSFIQYSDELTRLGLSEKFNDSSIQSFHEAKVPSSFLQQLNELGLLDKVSSESIIKAYQEVGN